MAKKKVSKKVVEQIKEDVVEVKTEAKKLVTSAKGKAKDAFLAVRQARRKYLSSAKIPKGRNNPAKATEPVNDEG